MGTNISGFEIADLASINFEKVVRNLISASTIFSEKKSIR